MTHTRRRLAASRTTGAAPADLQPVAHKSGRLLGALVVGLVALTLTGTLAAQEPAAPTPVQQAAQRAEALTEAQIGASHDARTLQRLVQLYASIGDKDRYRWSLQRLNELLPGELAVKMQLAASYASDDMKTPAYDLLLKMKGQGFGVDLADMPEFSKIHGTEVWDYIVQSLQANLKTFGKGQKAFDLPATDLLFHALGWDPVHEKFLAGSARDGGIYHVDKSGKLKRFIAADAKNQLWSIMDLAVDAAHNKLWVATTSVVYFKNYDPDNAGRAAVVAFDLASGKLLKRYPLSGRGVFVSDLALAPDGTVYAADGVNRVLYRIADDKLEQIASNPKLYDIMALAVSSDGKNLYMADSKLGLIGLDLGSGEAFGVGYNRDGLVLPGIVDMHAYKNTLVIIEPGMQPQRVMRLKLSDDGHAITSAMPLDVANPLFTRLGNGVAVGSKLYYMTNDQRDKYDDHGLLRDGAVLGPVHVFESDMDFAWDKEGISTALRPIPAAKPGHGVTLQDGN